MDDRYYSYARLDPLATTPGAAANFAELQSHMTKKQPDHAAVLLATATNLANKVWFSGASDLVQAINDPERHWGSYARRMGASFVATTFSAQVAKSIDPNLRAAQTMLDAITARIPFASRSVQPPWGGVDDPITARSSVGPALALPIWATTRRNDPTNNALIALGPPINAPQRSYKDGDKTAQGTPEQYSQIQRLAGGRGKASAGRADRQPRLGSDVARHPTFTGSEDHGRGACLGEGAGPRHVRPPGRPRAGCQPVGELRNRALMQIPSRADPGTSSRRRWRTSSTPSARMRRFRSAAAFGMSVRLAGAGLVDAAGWRAVEVRSGKRKV